MEPRPLVSSEKTKPPNSREQAAFTITASGGNGHDTAQKHVLIVYRVNHYYYHKFLRSSGYKERWVIYYDPYFWRFADAHVLGFMIRLKPHRRGTVCGGRTAHLLTRKQRKRGGGAEVLLTPQGIP